MANDTLRTLIRHLHRVVDPAGLGGLSDGQLLDRFRGDRDEAAFEVLVWRHGPMVHNLCRRLLRDEQDAEDAFQAAFLILIRKVGSIHKDGSVASWLYKVAYRAALEARARSARRPDPLPSDAEPAAPDGDDPAWRELRPVLDEEVHRLPDKYREPFVLCYLEGQTTDEAARALKCPRGTVATRLAWARQRLRDRLVRRGVALSAGALAAALVPGAAVAAPRLFTSTLRTGLHAAGGVPADAVPRPVLSLAEGVLHAMFLSKVKTTAVVAIALVALVVGGVTVRETVAAGPTRPADERRDEPRKDRERRADEKPAPREREKRDGDARRPGVLEAQFVSADAAKNKLTAKVNANPGREKEPLWTETLFDLAKDVRVFVDRRAAALADLKAGQGVTLQLGPDGKTVVAINPVGLRDGEGGERRERDGDVRRPTRIAGQVKSVDAAKLTITAVVRERDGDEATPKTYAVSQDYSVLLNNRQAELGDLKPGMRVTLQFARDGRKVILVTVTPVRGQGEPDRN
jgi:RNA polymerase sigma factor (sigma-70 family)